MAIAEHKHATHVLLDQVAEFLLLGTITSMRGAESGAEMLALGRLACNVPDEIGDTPVFAAIRQLLGLFDEVTLAEPDNRRRLAFLMMAITTARTPDVPVPAIAG